MRDNDEYKKEIEAFIKNDIDKKLYAIYERLLTIQGRLSAVEARAAIWGSLTGGIILAIAGAFLYLTKG